MYFYDISFCNSKVGFAVGSAGLSERTTDGGATWVLNGPYEYYSDDYSLTDVDCVDSTHTWMLERL